MVDDVVFGESMSVVVRESGVVELFLVINVSLAEYGVKDDGDSSREWRDVRVLLLFVVKEFMYGVVLLI